MIFFYHIHYILFFFLQFIQQAIRKDFTNIEEILTPPEGVEEGVWKYEHLRSVFEILIN